MICIQAATNTKDTYHKLRSMISKLLRPCERLHCAFKFKLSEVIRGKWLLASATWFQQVLHMSSSQGVNCNMPGGEAQGKLTGTSAAIDFCQAEAAQGQWCTATHPARHNHPHHTSCSIATIHTTHSGCSCVLLWGIANVCGVLPILMLARDGPRRSAAFLELAAHAPGLADQLHARKKANAGDLLEPQVRRRVLRSQAGAQARNAHKNFSAGKSGTHWHVRALGSSTAVSRDHSPYTPSRVQMPQCMHSNHNMLKKKAHTQAPAQPGVLHVRARRARTHEWLPAHIGTQAQDHTGAALVRTCHMAVTRHPLQALHNC